ncbi:PREDICTED: protein Iojap, chloroplastic [Nicotiana attenuata]|uniref:Protein Iojap, chloroplastic n=1 Tax=Nicotiana attenuata TaxID=49451 RepID=A0A1J6INT1_NICAT|nr:PREDICTED: protein Iojap, chloroplastic [Nicotiana attenuata]OIS96808.1 protein iojap, chloroplastic [Nicotiana attenuata]
MELHSCIHPLPCTPSTGILVSGGRTEAKFAANPRKLHSLTLNSVPFSSKDYNLGRSSSTDFSRMAIGSDVSEDTDDMFDDLLKKHGKVVYRRNDQKPATEEIDDDAESLSFAVAVAKVASDVKAGDIKVLFVKPLVYWTRFFIIATAFSRPQIDAIGTRIRDMAEVQYGRVASGDFKPNSWTLLDFGDVVVHIFLPQQREYYNLEEFYGNAAPIELPFENQQLRGSKGY